MIGRGSRSDVPSSEFFVVRDGALAAEGVSLEAIAHEVGTPCYVYSAGALDDALARMRSALSWAPSSLIAYAVKANGNPAVIARLARGGAGADIVSGGELRLALAAGVPQERIVFSGVGKRDDEIATALDAEIRAIHVESAQELDVVSGIAREIGVRAPIALRVCPEVDAATHPYLATGVTDTKFGLAIDDARALLPRILADDALSLEGVAAHIGSQLPDPAGLAAAVAVVAGLAREAMSRGAKITTIDAGGGWPITYGDEDAPFPPWSAFGDAVHEGVRRGGVDPHDVTISVEPGRALVGDAGILLTRVLYTKEQPLRNGGRKRFVVVDAAMTELVRPALYGAYHAILPVRAPALDAAAVTVDVVGPVCETGDFLAQDRPLPPLVRGDLVAIRGAGAYAASMSSGYNARPRAVEVLVEGSTHRVVTHGEEDFDPSVRR